MSEEKLSTSSKSLGDEKKQKLKGGIETSVLEATTLTIPSLKDKVQLPDENIVDFDGDDDPANPLNWSSRHKWTIISLISMVEVSVILATWIAAPVAPQILEEFNSHNDLYRNLLVSIWELGEVVGPLIAAPISELSGRFYIFHGANILFIIFAVGGALSTNINMLIAFRFLGGCSVACVALNPSIAGDMFIPEQRGKAMSLIYLCFMIGPVIGPIAGSYLGQAKGWRWCFWLVAILTAASELVLLFCFRETYKVRILAQKAKRLRKETGNQKLHSKYDTGRTRSQLFFDAIIRPLKLLFLSPIVFLISTYVSVVYGNIYIIMTVTAPAFEGVYGFSEGAVGLTYLGQAVGMAIGVLIASRAIDYWVKLKSATNQMTPEQRLPLMIVGGGLLPAGLFIFGWTMRSNVHWIVPIIGTGIIGLGLIFTLTPGQTYLVDAFGIHSASAVAATLVMRNIFGTVLPLAGPALFGKLGYGWGNSVLAFIALAFALTPLFLMLYGGRIRARDNVSL